MTATTRDLPLKPLRGTLTTTFRARRAMARCAAILGTVHEAQARRWRDSAADRGSVGTTLPVRDGMARIARLANLHYRLAMRHEESTRGRPAGFYGTSLPVFGRPRP